MLPKNRFVKQAAPFLDALSKLILTQKDVKDFYYALKQYSLPEDIKVHDLACPGPGVFLRGFLVRHVSSALEANALYPVHDVRLSEQDGQLLVEVRMQGRGGEGVFGQVPLADLWPNTPEQLAAVAAGHIVGEDDLALLAAALAVHGPRFLLPIDPGVVHARKCLLETLALIVTQQSVERDIAQHIRRASELEDQVIGLRSKLDWGPKEEQHRVFDDIHRLEKERGELLKKAAELGKGLDQLGLEQGLAGLVEDVRRAVAEAASFLQPLERPSLLGAELLGRRSGGGTAVAGSPEGAGTSKQQQRRLGSLKAGGRGRAEQGAAAGASAGGAVGGGEGATGRSGTQGQDRQRASSLQYKYMDLSGTILMLLHRREGGWADLGSLTREGQEEVRALRERCEAVACQLQAAGEVLPSQADVVRYCAVRMQRLRRETAEPDTAAAAGPCTGGQVASGAPPAVFPQATPIPPYLQPDSVPQPLPLRRQHAEITRHRRQQPQQQQSLPPQCDAPREQSAHPSPAQPPPAPHQHQNQNQWHHSTSRQPSAAGNRAAAPQQSGAGVYSGAAGVQQQQQQQQLAQQPSLEPALWRGLLELNGRDRRKVSVAARIEAHPLDRHSFGSDGIIMASQRLMELPKGPVKSIASLGDISLALTERHNAKPPATPSQFELHIRTYECLIPEVGLLVGAKVQDLTSLIDFGSARGWYADSYEGRLVYGEFTVCWRTSGHCFLDHKLTMYIFTQKCQWACKRLASALPEEQRTCFLRNHALLVLVQLEPPEVTKLKESGAGPSRAATEGAERAASSGGRTGDVSAHLVPVQVAASAVATDVTSAGLEAAPPHAAAAAGTGAAACHSAAAPSFWHLQQPPLAPAVGAPAATNAVHPPSVMYEPAHQPQQPQAEATLQLFGDNGKTMAVNASASSAPNRAHPTPGAAIAPAHSSGMLPTAAQPAAAARTGSFASSTHAADVGALSTAGSSPASAATVRLSVNQTGAHSTEQAVASQATNGPVAPSPAPWVAGAAPMWPPLNPDLQPVAPAGPAVPQPSYVARPPLAFGVCPMSGSTPTYYAPYLVPTSSDPTRLPGGAPPAAALAPATLGVGAPAPPAPPVVLLGERPLPPAYAAGPFVSAPPPAQSAGPPASFWPTPGTSPPPLPQGPPPQGPPPIFPNPSVSPAPPPAPPPFSVGHPLDAPPLPAGSPLARAAFSPPTRPATSELLLGTAPPPVDPLRDVNALLSIPPQPPLPSQHPAEVQQLAPAVKRRKTWKEFSHEGKSTTSHTRQAEADAAPAGSDVRGLSGPSLEAPQVQPQPQAEPELLRAGPAAPLGGHSAQDAQHPQPQCFPPPTQAHYEGPQSQQRAAQTQLQQLRRPPVLLPPPQQQQQVMMQQAHTLAGLTPRAALEPQQQYDQHPVHLQYPSQGDKQAESREHERPDREPSPPSFYSDDEEGPGPQREKTPDFFDDSD